MPFERPSEGRGLEVFQRLAWDPVGVINSLQRRTAPRYHSWGGDCCRLPAGFDLGLCDQVVEDLAVARGGGQGRSPHEPRRLARAGRLVNPIAIRFAQPKCKDHLRLVRCRLLLQPNLRGLLLRGSLRALRSLPDPLARRWDCHGLLHGEDSGRLDPQGIPESVGQRILRRQLVPMVLAHAVVEVGDSGSGLAGADLALTEFHYLVLGVLVFPRWVPVVRVPAFATATRGVSVSHVHPSFPAGASRSGNKQSAGAAPMSRQFGWEATCTRAPASVA